MASGKQHWDSVYQDRQADQLGWYQDSPELSLELIDACPLDRSAALIDIGGGASSLAQHLLNKGFDDVSVLDISAAALHQARQRLGDNSKCVHWIEQDIVHFQPTRQYTLWHDRAVLHFLTADSEQRAYRDVLRQTLSAGGFIIIATFAPGGPDKCSGLRIVQYDAERLLEVLGADFELLRQRDEIHTTPAGVEQAFRYFLLHRL